MEVFIGRIPPNVGINKISEIFAPYGATNVRMLDGKGCAFATFANSFDAQRAITDLNGYQMGPGSPALNVKLADAKGGAPMGAPMAPPARAPIPAFRATIPVAPTPPATNPLSTAPQPQVFLGRLPADVKQEELEELLMPYGATTLKLLDGRNCAFVSFDSWAYAERCIEELNGAQLRDSATQTEGINVKFADMKGVQKGALQEPKVFIGGIGASVTQEAVQQYCEHLGNIVNCKIFVKDDRSLPCAFVTFANFTEAEKCIHTLNDQEHPLAAEGKTLVVKMADMAKSSLRNPGTIPTNPIRFTPAPSPAMPIPVVQHAPHVQHSQRAPMRPTMPININDDPRSQSMKDMRPSAGGVEEEKLFIGGLPEEANDDFLWGMMAPFGRVAEVKILRKNAATPCGFVSFSSVGEAEIALAALSNCRFTVKYANSKGTKRTASVAFEDHFEKRLKW